MTRCVVYLRISRDDELEGLGVERQLGKCRAMLPVGWEIVAVVDENDTSATKRKPRPKYQAMLADLQAGRFEAVMAYAQDRLTRKPIEAEALLELVDSHGVQIATSSAGVLRLRKGVDPDARHAFRNATAGAAREVEVTGMRVSDKCKQRAEMGRPQGRIPFGYRRFPVTDDQGNIILNTKGQIKAKIDAIYEPEAAVIRWAADQILAGRSIRSITHDLNQGEIRPVGGGSWDVRQVKRLLTMPTYAGLRVYRGSVIGQAVWPAIITVAQHHRLVAMFADPARKASYMGRAPQWLLSGIAHCGKCGPGSRIGVQHDKRPGRNAGSAYACVRADAQHPGCYGAVTLQEAEALVVGLVTDRLANPELGEPSADVAEQIEGLYLKISQIRDELIELANDEDLDLAQIKIMSARRRKTIKSIEDQISGLMPQVAQHVDLDWTTASVDEKRVVIRSMVKSIELHPGAPKVGRKRGFLASQVRIEWR